MFLLFFFENEKGQNLVIKCVINIAVEMVLAAGTQGSIHANGQHVLAKFSFMR